MLTGAVLWRVRRLYGKPENVQKSTENRCDDTSQTSRAGKNRILRDRARLGVDVGGRGALPGAPRRSSWRPGPLLGTPRAIPGRAGGATRCFQDASGASRQGPIGPGSTDLARIDRPRLDLGARQGRNGLRASFRERFGGRLGAVLASFWRSRATSSHQLDFRSILASKIIDF